MKITVHRNVKPGEEVFTGIPGQYLTAPEHGELWDFVEYAHENEDGQLIHDRFSFELVE